MAFRDELAEWTDWDLSAYALARELGIITSDWLSAKGIFWSNNPLGNALTEMLLSLTRAGVLEFRDEPDKQFRWRAEPRPPTDSR